MSEEEVAAAPAAADAGAKDGASHAQEPQTDAHPAEAATAAESGEVAEEATLVNPEAGGDEAAAIGPEAASVEVQETGGDTAGGESRSSERVDDSGSHNQEGEGDATAAADAGAAAVVADAADASPAAPSADTDVAPADAAAAADIAGDAGGSSVAAAGVAAAAAGGEHVVGLDFQHEPQEHEIRHVPLPTAAHLSTAPAVVCCHLPPPLLLALLECVLSVRVTMRTQNTKHRRECNVGIINF